MPRTNLQQQTVVHALPSKIWRVLTFSTYVNQYLSQRSLQSDWIEGSTILHSSEGSSVLTAVGKVLEAVPGILLKFSVYEEQGVEMITTTYELIVASDGVELKMKCEGFNATNSEYIIRVQQANLILQKIKWLSEYS